jgi:hypothetical protein
MILALFITAGLMALAGAFSVVTGWDIVLNERGWTQVISGTVLLAGGFVLFGIAVVARELQRLRSELVAAVAIPEDEVAEVPAAPVPPAPAPVVPDLSRALGRIPEPAKPEPVESAAMHVPELKPTVHEAAPADAFARSFESQPPHAPGEPEPAPSLPAALPAEEAKPEEVPEPSVVGTYASGGITYFMYSDDSIEADMEGGRYRFNSMEDLRHFLETGEGGTLLAPADERVPIAT